MWNCSLLFCCSASGIAHPWLWYICVENLPLMISSVMESSVCIGVGGYGYAWPISSSICSGDDVYSGKIGICVRCHDMFDDVCNVENGAVGSW